MERKVVCTVCPAGCEITVTGDRDSGFSFDGYKCEKGCGYARTEMENPSRILTTTVRVEGGRLPVIPVRSSCPLPLDKTAECMKIINRVIVSSPVEMGQIVIDNILDTGADIITSRSL